MTDRCERQDRSETALFAELRGIRESIEVLTEMTSEVHRDLLHGKARLPAVAVAARAGAPAVAAPNVVDDYMLASATLSPLRFRVSATSDTGTALNPAIDVADIEMASKAGSRRASPSASRRSPVQPVSFFPSADDFEGRRPDVKELHPTFDGVESLAMSQYKSEQFISEILSLDRRAMADPFSPSLRARTRTTSMDNDGDGSGELMPRRISLGSSSSTDLGLRFAGLRCFPLHPTSAARLIFDMLSVLTLLYDLITVPYMLAWDVPENGTLLVVSAAAIAFWTIDLILNFLTGIADDERIVLSFKEIAKRYLRTWFLLDFFVLTSDVIALIGEQVFKDGSSWGFDSRFLKLGRFGKIGRLVRVVILLRAGRVQKVYSKMMQLMRRVAQQQTLDLILSVLKLLFVIAWLNHMGACMWYAVATMAPSDTGVRWIDLLQADTDGGSAKNAVFMYMLGVYWSVTSMFSGGSFILPSNSFESFFCQMFLTFGLLFSSALISTLAATLIKFEAENQERNGKLRELRRFLRQHKVDSLLSDHIQKQIVERTEGDSHLFYANVSTLTLLSAYLRAELHYNIFATYLLRCDIIRACDHVDTKLARDLAAAVLVQCYQTGHELFQANMPIDQVFFVMWGSLEYTPWSDVGSVRRKKVETGQRVCEIALWVRWRARGMLEVESPCELLTLGADAFESTLSWNSHRQIARTAKKFGALLCDAIEREQPDCIDDLSTGVDHDAVVACLPPDLRTELSLPLMGVLKRHQSSNYWGLFQGNASHWLEEEIREAKCHLTQDSQGHVMRVASVVALRLMRQHAPKETDEDESSSQTSNSTLLCIELACKRGDEVSVTIVKPGTKVRSKETPQRALQRMLEARLPMFQDCSEAITEDHVEIDITTSQKYNIVTKYVRRVFGAPAPDEIARELCGAQGQKLEFGVPGSIRKISLSPESLFLVRHERLRLFSPAPLSPNSEVTEVANPGTSSKSMGRTPAPKVRDSERIFYSWMPEEDFSFLSQAGGEVRDAIGEWVGRLSMRRESEGSAVSELDADCA